MKKLVFSVEAFPVQENMNSSYLLYLIILIIRRNLNKIEKKNNKKMSQIQFLPIGTKLYSVGKIGDKPRIWFLNKGKAILWGILLFSSESDFSYYVLKEVEVKSNLKYITVIVDKSVLDKEEVKPNIFIIKITSALDVYGSKVQDIAFGFSDTNILNSDMKEYKVDWRRISLVLSMLIQQSQQIKLIKDTFRDQSSAFDPYLSVTKINNRLITLQKQLETMDANIIRSIALNLEGKDLLNLCLVSSRINSVVCANRNFWFLKMQRDFPEEMNKKPADIGWKKYYTRLNKKKRVVEFFEKYIDRVNWDRLSRNPNLPVEFFEKYIDKVDWYWLSENPNLPTEFFEKYIDKVDWNWLSRNPNLPVEFFEKYIDRVNWKYLSGNTFNKWINA